MTERGRQTMKSKHKRRFRIVVVVLAGLVALGALKFPSKGERFFERLEQYPVACFVIRPLFAVAGRGSEFDRGIMRARLIRQGVDPDLAEYYETLP